MILFMVDLDGCIIDGRARYKAAGAEPDGDKNSEAYQTWVKTVMNQEMMAKDSEVPGTRALLHSIRAQGHRVIFVTSREECHREVTRKWIEDHGYGHIPSQLVMRPQGCLDVDHALKEQAIVTEMNRRHSEPIDAVVVMDDDLKGGLAKVCAKHGWTMLKVVGYSL